MNTDEPPSSPPSRRTRSRARSAPRPAIAGTGRTRKKAPAAGTATQEPEAPPAPERAAETAYDEIAEYAGFPGGLGRLASDNPGSAMTGALLLGIGLGVLIGIWIARD